MRPQLEPESRKGAHRQAYTLAVRTVARDKKANLNRLKQKRGRGSGSMY